MAASPARRRVAVMMLPARIKLDIDQVELPVTYAALGDQCVRKAADGSGRSAQDDAFKAIFMIEMDMQGRHRKIVLAVLQAGEAFRQITLVVVVDVGQTGDAMSRIAAFLARLLKMRPQQIAHRLRTVFIATLGDQPVKFGGQIGVE